MNGTAERRASRRDATHHGLGHFGRMNLRGHRRVTGRHIQVGVTVEEADYADRLRRSSGWVPKHRADA